MYRTICTHLWTDKKIQSLSVQGKLLFVYLITNPHSHMCGIYYLPEELIKKEAGLSDTLCHTLWDTLSGLNLAHYDHETSTVFIVNMFSYQGKGEKNEKCASKHLDTLHDSRLIDLFVERYSTVKQFLSDTLSYTLCHRDTEPSKRCPSVPNPNPLLLITPNQDLKSKDHSKRKSIGLHEWPDDFVLSDEMKSRAVALGMNPFIEFAKFKDHHLAKGSRFKDWGAAWRTWTRNGVEFKEARQ